MDIHFWPRSLSDQSGKYCEFRTIRLDLPRSFHRPSLDGYASRTFLGSIDELVVAYGLTISLTSCY